MSRIIVQFRSDERRGVCCCIGVSFRFNSHIRDSGIFSRECRQEYGGYEWEIECTLKYWKSGCRHCPEQTVLYFGKNKGFKTVVCKAKGIDLNDPQENQIYSFAPCTSVDVERFFSNLNHFVADRSNMTPAEATLEKFLFVQYNSVL